MTSMLLSVEYESNFIGGVSAMKGRFALKVLSGNANKTLAEEICRYLGIELVKMRCSRFPDGEIDVKVEEDMRGCDAFVVQPTSPPVNENLMELLVILDCLRRASAARITAVIPYFGYARQDRKAEGRVPITAKLVANLITKAGANRVLTMDLHAPQIQGFFDIPVDELWAYRVFVPHIRETVEEPFTVLSPDVGGVKMVRAYSKRLNCDLALVDKRRVSGSETISYHLIGDVKDRHIVMIDDIIATGGTVVDAAHIAKEHGALSVGVCATHGIFVGNALERLSSPHLDWVAVTNTIPPKINHQKISYLSVAGLLGEAIKRIHEDRSVSELFD